MFHIISTVAAVATTFTHYKKRGNIEMIQWRNIHYEQLFSSTLVIIRALTGTLSSCWQRYPSSSLRQSSYDTLIEKDMSGTGFVLYNNADDTWSFATATKMSMCLYWALNPMIQWNDCWRPVICVTRGPFYKHGWTLIPAWISNHIHDDAWNEITYPFPKFKNATFQNFNGCTVEVW